MRFLLSFLLCIVFLQAQTFAQNADQSNNANNNHVAANGGPNYGSLGTVTGTYAGVLIPTSVSSPTPNVAPVTSQEVSNSIGVFALSIPRTGVGTGAFLLFTQGGVTSLATTGGLSFSGNLAVIADPSSSTIRGILSATATISQTTETLSSGTTNLLTLTTNSVSDTAVGEINAVVGQSSTAGGSASLTGTAFVTVSSPAVANTAFANGIQPEGISYLNLTVQGFQQSTATSGVTSISL